MKTTQLLKFLLAGLVFSASSAQALVVTANWNDNAADNAWETAGNWDINQVPTNNSFNVSIGIAAPCNLTNGYQINALSLTVNTAQLNLIPGALLAFTGNIVNNGAIVVDTTGANATTQLRFDANVSVTGSGTIQLNGFGSNYNVADFNTNGSTVTLGSSQILHGKGTVLGGGILINNGTINGDDSSGNNLQLDLSDPGNISNQNNGLIEASNGGVLGFYSGTIDQTLGSSTGQFLATGANSIVQFGGSNFVTLIGGSVTTAKAGVVLGVNAAWGSVTSGGTVQIPGNDILVIFGSGLTDNGTVLVNSTDPTNSTSVLRYDASGALGGTGIVTLNGNVYNRADLIVSDTFTVTNGANHTINGKGDIGGNGGTHFTNNGVVNANATPRGIVFDGGLAVTNNKTLEATSGSVLTLDNSSFGVDQTGGGTILASGAGSVVQFGGNTTARIIGGTVTTASGGVLNSVASQFFGVTNSGDFRIPGGDYALVLGTGLTDNATIKVNSTDPDNSTSTIRFDATGALDGTGVLTLNGNVYNRANLIVSDTFTVTNGANHTINGKGDIVGNGGTHFTNNGVVNANATPRGIAFEVGLAVANNNLLEATNGSQLTLDNSSFGVDQTGGGTILATGTGSVVQLGGATTAKITGGILNTTSGGLISSVASALAGEITNSNAFQVGENSYVLSYATTLTNNGAMTLTDSTSLFRFDLNNTSIAGTGAIILTNGALMRISGGQTVTNGANHTLKGNGTIDIVGGGTLMNNGTIAPGLSPGQLNYSGTLTLGSTSNLSFEIAGTTPGTLYGVLNKTDGAPQTLGGNLHVRLLNGFTPANSDTYNIVTTQNTLAGAFANVTNGARLTTDDGGGSFKVTYSVPNNALASRNVTLSDFQAVVNRNVLGQGTIAVPKGKASFWFNIIPPIGPNSYQWFGYQDNVAGVYLNTASISTLSVSGNTAHFTGMAPYHNNSAVRFTVDVVDGDGKRTFDRFSIQLSNGYSRSGTVQQGYITIK